MTEIPRNFHKDMHLAAVLSEAVSHKLNNSLSGILGYIQFTMEKINKDFLSRDEIEKVLGYLQLAQDESLVSRNIMRELRWFSKQYLGNEEMKQPHNPVIKNLKAFWEMISGSEIFKRLNIIWDESRKHETRADISRESLFCFFYTLVLGIVKLGNESEVITLHISYGDKNDKYKDTVFNFSLHDSFTKEEVDDCFILSLALIKSLFGKMSLSLEGRDVRLIVGLPLNVEKV